MLPLRASEAGWKWSTAHRCRVELHAEGAVHVRGDRPQRSRIGDHDARAEPPAAAHHALGRADQLDAPAAGGFGKLRVHRVLAGAVLPRDLAHARIHADLAQGLSEHGTEEPIAHRVAAAGVGGRLEVVHYQASAVVRGGVAAHLTHQGPEAVLLARGHGIGESGVQLIAAAERHRGVRLVHA